MSETNAVSLNIVTSVTSNCISPVIRPIEVAVVFVVLVRDDVRLVVLSLELVFVRVLVVLTLVLVGVKVTVVNVSLPVIVGLLAVVSLKLVPEAVLVAVVVV
jgi:hypothetical protein